MAPARDDVNELNRVLVSFIEDPIMLEGKACKIGRVIMICFADTGKIRNEGANRHQICDKFAASIFPKLVIDVDCNVISLAAKGRCKDNASHAPMESVPFRWLVIRRFISSK
jgi:hypothetical protein